MKKLCIISLLIVNIPAIALETLGVKGQVENAAPYYERLILQSKPERPILDREDQIRVKKWSGTMVFETQLKPKNIQRKQFVKPMALISPVCVVANDAISKKWLTKNKALLVKIKPVCYLARISSQNDIEALQSLVKEIQFVGINPSHIVKRLKIEGYPILISSKGIEQ